MKKIILVVLTLVIFSQTTNAQTKEIYTNPLFNSVASNHQILAILPFDVVMQLRPNQMKAMNSEQLARIETKEGLAVQNALHSYFLRKKTRKGFKVDFQDIAKTNRLLRSNEIDLHNIADYSHEELASLLGVDGIVSGSLFTHKPISEGASMAMGFLTGYFGPTNSGKCTIAINDANDGTLLWKYEKTLSRSLGSSTNTIINNMMRKASRKLPYNRI